MSSLALSDWSMMFCNFRSYTLMSPSDLPIDGLFFQGAGAFSFQHYEGSPGAVCSNIYVTYLQIQSKHSRSMAPKIIPRIVGLYPVIRASWNVCGLAFYLFIYYCYYFFLQCCFLRGPAAIYFILLPMNRFSYWYICVLVDFSGLLSATIWVLWNLLQPALYLLNATVFFPGAAEF